MENETIMIDGVRYYADRPSSCRGCFFWKNRKAGCSFKKENCYYLAESPKQKSPCKGCCYGPCISFCKGLWAKIPADGTTVVTKPTLQGKDEAGKNVWQDEKTRVPNTELKAMVESYKTRASQTKEAQPRESAMEKLDALVKDTPAKVSLDKSKAKAKSKKGPEL